MKLTDEQKQTLIDLLQCCYAWEGSVRIVGNVRADKASDAIREALRLAEQNAVGQEPESATIGADSFNPRPQGATSATSPAPAAPGMPPEPYTMGDYQVGRTDTVVLKSDYDALRTYALAQRNRAEAAERDAARYRWLRDSIQTGTEAHEISLDADEMTAEQFDAAIDRAMAGAETGKE